ncbi:MAG TPA: hypothetical protein VMZ92_13075 [Planctomycetota bacterium]|nr:hypothetical protein [Planctomycetota bacterium]
MKSMPAKVKPYCGWDPLIEEDWTRVCYERSRNLTAAAEKRFQEKSRVITAEARKRLRALLDAGYEPPVRTPWD